MNVDDTAAIADQSGAVERRIGGPLHCRHPDGGQTTSASGAAGDAGGVVAMGQQLTRGQRPQSNVDTDPERKEEEQHVSG